jgi:hypothetical protein
MKTFLSLGKIVITPNARDHLQPEDVLVALSRHVSGDWGDLDDHDRAVNDFALENFERILSAYSDRTGTTFWIITEADRSVTTILLPEDY